MPTLRNCLIRSYRYATWPWRYSVMSQLARKNKMPIYVLFYHRVADEFLNPWTISCKDFVRHIDWLSANFDLISLREAQARIVNGNDRPAVAITFDDGYAENCSFALPLLIERNIPTTYFVTTYHTAHNRPFPHDVERNEPLAPNSIDSLRALSNAGVEIGGHTRTHVDLGSGLENEVIFDEVIAATREMESMLDCTIDYFAFPYGQLENLDPRVFWLLKENRFRGVCSAYGGLNEIGRNPFHLQRVHGDPNLERLKNWLTIDPRIFKVKNYDCQSGISRVADDSNTSANKKPVNSEVNETQTQGF